MENTNIQEALSELRRLLEQSKKFNNAFDASDASWRDGMEAGLTTAIEVLEEIISKQS